MHGHRSSLGYVKQEKKNAYQREREKNNKTWFFHTIIINFRKCP